ncbi:TPA: hypothetical protein EYP83_01220 [Candidatus Geothermarchaeota archaeon]|nr:hypothetical protein [Candidatus Geothermarchaeota archaeon]
MALDSILIYEQHLMFVLGVAIIIGYIGGRLFISRGIPGIVGYMVVGVLLGEALLGFITEEDIKFLIPFVDLALAFIGFGIGVELRIDRLKHLVREIASITLFHTLVILALVGIPIYLYTRDPAITILLSTIALSTAPAATVKVLWEYNAEGEVTMMLYTLVAVYDIVTSLVFAFAYPYVESIIIGFSEMTVVLAGTLYHLMGSILLGLIAGFILDGILGLLHRESDMVWTLALANILITGIAESFGFSTILMTIIAGFVAVNLRGPQEEEIFQVVKYGVEPILILFFVTMGAHIKFEYFGLIGLTGVLYLVLRGIGKYIGSYIGSYISNSSVKVKRYIGLGLLSQGGLSLALASKILIDFSGISSYATTIASTVFTVILATTFIFEVIGPILVKYVVIWSGEAGRGV